MGLQGLLPLISHLIALISSLKALISHSITPLTPPVPLATPLISPADISDIPDIPMSRYHGNIKVKAFCGNVALGLSYRAFGHSCSRSPKTIWAVFVKGSQGPLPFLSGGRTAHLGTLGSRFPKSPLLELFPQRSKNTKQSSRLHASSILHM